MSARKKKKKQQQNKRPRPLRPGRPLKGPFADSIIVDTPPGAEKMSEVILKFIEPYIEEETVEGLKKVLGVAMLAWNTSLFPPTQRVKVLQQMVDSAPPDLRSGLRAMVEEMIQRKLVHFASNTRFILDYQVTMTPAGPHVLVMSSLPP